MAVASRYDGCPLGSGWGRHSRTRVHADSSRIKVVFWHEMKGPGQQAIDATLVRLITNSPNMKL